MRFGPFGRLLAAAGFAAIASAPTQAMTLIVQKGEVLVNRGDGFQAVTGSVEIEPGATVVVQEGGGAEFVCSDSSRLAMVPGYHPVPADCAPSQTQAFQLDTAGYLLISAGVLGGAIAIIESTGGDNNKSASAQ